MKRVSIVMDPRTHVKLRKFKRLFGFQIGETICAAVNKYIDEEMDKRIAEMKHNQICHLQAEIGKLGTSIEELEEQINEIERI